jgi:predicted AlkP superfamily phosphohydrolase/phosphomutase
MCIRDRTDFYRDVDAAVGRVQNQYDPDDPSVTIMLMSDHGFTSFRRQVNLNTWLHEQGLIALTNTELDSTGYFTHVDWLNTKAYAVGINSLYLNLKGREKYGGLHASLASRTRENLREALLALIDPATGVRAAVDVRIVPDEERQAHPHAPDLIVGWNAGFRTAWNSILGGFSPDVFSDNLDKWSGDHCMAPQCVPATLITNKPFSGTAPSLESMAATILAPFGLDAPYENAGASLIKTS